MSATPYYDYGGITLYHADCRDIAGLSPGVVISDPPYGIDYSSGRIKTSGGRYARADGSIEGDSDGRWAYDWLSNTFPNLPMAVFAAWQHGPPWPDRTALLVWDKGAQFGMGDLSIPWKPNHEPIWVYGSGWHGRRTTSVLRGYSPSSWTLGRQHPHEKPISLLAELVGKSPPGVILDPFAGSGSTLIAARDAGREAIGIEIEERYCETIALRLAQGSLFAEMAE